jgi:hypothetical protein
LGLSNFINAAAFSNDLDEFSVHESTVCPDTVSTHETVISYDVTTRFLFILTTFWPKIIPLIIQSVSELTVLVKSISAAERLFFNPARIRSRASVFNFSFTSESTSNSFTATLNLYFF